MPAPVLFAETTPLPSSSGLPSIGAADKTHYQVLGVSYSATQTEITRAYREAMKHVHPDRAHPERRVDAEEEAKRLNLAFATLSKPAARRAYDDTIKERVLQDQIMSRYVGGFAGPGMEMGGAFGQALRREMTRAERREQSHARRSATVSIVIAFVGLAAVIVVMLLAFAVVSWLIETVF